jgi:hypothetical protein
MAGHAVKHIIKREFSVIRRTAFTANDELFGGA